MAPPSAKPGYGHTAVDKMPFKFAPDGITPGVVGHGRPLDGPGAQGPKFIPLSNGLIGTWGLGNAYAPNPKIAEMEGRLNEALTGTPYVPPNDKAAKLPVVNPMFREMEDRITAFGEGRPYVPPAPERPMDYQMFRTAGTAGSAQASAAQPAQAPAAQPAQAPAAQPAQAPAAQPAQAPVVQPSVGTVQSGSLSPSVPRSPAEPAPLMPRNPTAGPAPPMPGTPTTPLGTRTGGFGGPAEDARRHELQKLKLGNEVKPMIVGSEEPPLPLSPVEQGHAEQARLAADYSLIGGRSYGNRYGQVPGMPDMPVMPRRPMMPGREAIPELGLPKMPSSQEIQADILDTLDPESPMGRALAVERALSERRPGQRAIAGITPSFSPGGVAAADQGGFTGSRDGVPGWAGSTTSGINQQRPRTSEEVTGAFDDALGGTSSDEFGEIDRVNRWRGRPQVGSNGIGGDVVAGGPTAGVVGSGGKGQLEGMKPGTRERMLRNRMIRDGMDPDDVPNGLSKMQEARQDQVAGQGTSRDDRRRMHLQNALTMGAPAESARASMNISPRRFGSADANPGGSKANKPYADIAGRLDENGKPPAVGSEGRFGQIRDMIRQAQADGLDRDATVKRLRDNGISEYEINDYLNDRKGHVWPAESDKEAMGYLESIGWAPAEAAEQTPEKTPAEISGPYDDLYQAPFKPASPGFTKKNEKRYRNYIQDTLDGR